MSRCVIPINTTANCLKTSFCQRNCPASFLSTVSAMSFQFARVSSGVTAYLAKPGMTPITLEGNRFQQSTLLGQTIK